MPVTKAIVDRSSSRHEERELIAATLAGQADAFEELVRRNHDQLYNTLMRVVQSADMTEEFVQDTFVQAYLKLDTFEQRAAFSTWLFRIAYNKYLTWRRSRKATISIESIGDHSHAQPIDPHDSGECVCARSETREKVSLALQNLDENSRSILILREIDGLSYEEIGVAMKLKPGTVRSRISRARGKLLRELKANSDYGSAFI